MNENESKANKKSLDPIVSVRPNQSFNEIESYTVKYLCTPIVTFNTK